MSAPSVISPFPPIPASNLLPGDIVLATATLGQTQTPSHQQTGPISPTHKEASPILQSESTAPTPEVAKLVEIQENEPLPAEVEGWLQKLDQEGDIDLDKPLTHDGDILLASTEAQIVKEKIVLPMTQSAVQQGLTQKVSNSARWLAEWCLRLIKIMQDKVKYAPEQIKSN